MLTTIIGGVLFALLMALSVGVLYSWNQKKQAEKAKQIQQAKKEKRRQEEEKKRQWELRKPAEVTITRTTTDAPVKRGRASLVLLVEDSPTMLLALRKILERWNYRVITAVDGRQAWAELQKNKPDLVISDIDMPQMNGLELLKLMRGDILFMHIPVILITGNASYHLEASHQAGVNGLISKPFEDKSLIDQVRYVLQE